MKPTRALTIRNPWAWAIVHAGKRIENRTWHTQFRGPIYIHAGSKAVDPTARRELAGKLQRLGIPYPDEDRLICGALVATANIIDCVRLPPSGLGAWGDPNAWHFLLDDVTPLARPIPMAGKLNLWRI